MRLSRTISRLCHAAAWGGLLSASLWLVGFAVVPGYAQVLTHGPVTGGVDANNAKVFVRTSAAASVMVQYGTFPTLPHPNSSKPATTSALHDYTAIVQLKSLKPLTTYYLNVLVNGVPQLAQPYPSFTTFPIQGTPSNFKFVVMTDFDSVLNPPPITSSFASAAAEHPAFAFIGGDFDHTNEVTLAGHRLIWQALYDPNTSGMADFVNLILRKMPFAHQWDDNDSGANNDDKTFVGLPNAYQAFTEYMPMYSSPAPPGSFGIWQKFSYGQVDFFILDCRSQRDNGYAIDSVNKSMLDGRHLGPANELTWLENGLLTSSATWKIVFTSVPGNPTIKFPDGWSSYQTGWSRLRSFIQQNSINNVIFISGDVHIGAIDNGTASGFPEMLVGPVNYISHGSPSCATGRIGTWSQGIYNPISPTPCYQYGVVTVTTNPDQVILQIKDQTGVTKLSYLLNAS